MENRPVSHNNFSEKDIEIDWNYRANAGPERRKHLRIDGLRISTHFRAARPVVEIVMFNSEVTGELLNICEGGFAAVFHEACDLAQVVTVYCTFPDREIIAEARIQRKEPGADGVKTAGHFLDLKTEDALYLASLLASCKVQAHE